MSACKGGNDTPTPTPTPTPATPVLTTITVSPATSTVAVGASQQFTSEGKDQYGKSISVTPTWTVNGSSGTLSTTGLFIATTAGTATVTASSGGVTGTATITVPAPSTPVGKSHTITFNYINSGLDKAKAGTTTYNLGAGIRLYVDGKPLNLAGSLASGDTTYYVSPQTPNAAIDFPKTFTVTGTILKMEVGFYNVRGTIAAPTALNGQAMSMPFARLALTPVVDGVPVTSAAFQVGSYNTVPTLTYDNGRNPTRITTLDMSKL